MNKTEAKKILNSNPAFRAIRRQCAPSPFAEFCGNLLDAAHYGAQSGCLPRFIYSGDNAKFFARHREEIVERLFGEMELPLDALGLSEFDAVAQTPWFIDKVVWAWVEAVASECEELLEVVVA